MWVMARKPSEFLVLVADDVGDIGYTTVTDLELVLVDYLAQFRLVWEVLTYQLKNTAADFGYDAFAKRRIEPNYIELALTFPSIWR